MFLMPLATGRPCPACKRSGRRRTDWRPRSTIRRYRAPIIDKEGHVVFLIIAYGESQSDRLQLHHPEVCYTAQGFRVSRPVTSTFHWSPSAPPIVLTRLVATREDRLEPISYWMRIGYDVSNSNWARNALKLEYGLRGWIPDGALFRVSTFGLPPDVASSFRTSSSATSRRTCPPKRGLHGRRSGQGALSWGR